MKQLQTIVGLVLLIIGLVFLCYDLWEQRNAVEMTLDWHVKIALGIAGTGLLLLPFDFSNLRRAYREYKGK